MSEYQKQIQNAKDVKARLAANEIKKFDPRKPAKPPRIISENEPLMYQIVRETASEHCVTVQDMKLRKPTRRASFARDETMWHLKSETSLTMTQIGQVFKISRRAVYRGIEKHKKRIYRLYDGTAV